MKNIFNHLLDNTTLKSFLYQNQTGKPKENPDQISPGPQLHDKVVQDTTERINIYQTEVIQDPKTNMEVAQKIRKAQNFYGENMSKEDRETVISEAVNLQRNGINVIENPLFMSGFSLEKAKSEKYITNLVTLHNAGILINWSFVDRLSLAQGENSNLIEALIVLHENGFEDIREILPLEHMANSGIPIPEIIARTQSEKYIHNLAMLSQPNTNNGFKMHYFVFRNFTLEKGESLTFTKNFLNLVREFGSKEVGWICMEKLTLEKGENTEFIDLVIKKGRKDDNIRNIIESTKIPKSKNVASNN